MSFVLWVFFGLFLARRLSGRIAVKSPWFGIGLMVGGAVLMLATLLALGSARPIVQGTLTLWAWAVTTVAGTIFVTLQALGCLLTLRCVSTGETSPSPQASESQESE